ncbi:MAG: hypothetical protein RQ728_03210 [Brevefilum sp.]|nr:hypothetical protein [Brevefilum sp.]
MVFEIFGMIWRWFIKPLKYLTLLISLWMILPGCLSSPANPNTGELQASPTASIEVLPTTAPNQTHAPLPQQGGPFLLIQTNLEEYNIFDLSTGESASFMPPTTNRGFSLNDRLSPSGQKMFFFDAQGNIILTDLTTGQILETHSPSNNALIFDLNLAVEEARASLTEIDYPDANLLTAIETAYKESITDIRWYQNDQYMLTVHDSTPTSTNLSLLDLASKTQIALEKLPGLILDYRVSPGGKHILVKKAYVDDPQTWMHDLYYLINVDTKEVQPIPMPSLVDNPSLSWLNNELIGINHQMHPIGGVDYSIFNLNNQALRQVIKGPYTHTNQYKDRLFVLKQNNASDITTISLINYEGETLKQQELNDRCLYKGRMGDFILINCATDSLLLDEILHVTPLGDRVSLLSSAPGGDNVIFVNQDDGTFLLNQISLERQPVLLEGTPLEIRWLPDGSAFLYRLSGELYLYDVNRKQSTLILTSANLSDYSNINAVWIDMN